MDTSVLCQVQQEAAQPLQELDPHRLSQRQRQIDFGKNTVGYTRYTSQVARAKRRKFSMEHPNTPDIHNPISKRMFDGQIRAWRRALHDWEDPTSKLYKQMLLEGALLSPGSCASDRPGSYAAALSGSAPSSRAPSEAGATPRQGRTAATPGSRQDDVAEMLAPVRARRQAAPGAARNPPPPAAAGAAAPAGKAAARVQKRVASTLTPDQDLQQMQSPTKKLRHITPQAISISKPWPNENQTPHQPSGKAAPQQAPSSLLAQQQQQPGSRQSALSSAAAPAAPHSAGVEQPSKQAASAAPPAQGSAQPASGSAVPAGDKPAAAQPPWPATGIFGNWEDIMEADGL